LLPLAVEKSDGWSCHRCTLINYNAQIWCEACGGKRLDDTTTNGEDFSTPTAATLSKLAIDKSELDVDSEDVPPRIGHVLDKLVLFTAIEAKSKETPSLQRRSGEFGRKLLHSQHQHQYLSGSTSMLPIDENPLQKTLERITNNQAQLIRSHDYSNRSIAEVVNSSRIMKNQISKEASQKDPAVMPNLYQANVETSASDQHVTGLAIQVKSKTQTHQDIVSQQEYLLEEARKNLAKQKQHEQSLDLSDQAATIQKPGPDVQLRIEKESLWGSLSNEKAFQIQRERPEIQQFGRTSPTIFSHGSSDLDKAVSTGASFDFTKTPRSFLLSNLASTRKAAITAPPRLEILSASITRKYSETDRDDKGKERLQFLDDKNDATFGKENLPLGKEKHLEQAFKTEGTKVTLKTLTSTEESTSIETNERVQNSSKLHVDDSYQADMQCIAEKTVGKIMPPSKYQKLPSTVKATTESALLSGAQGILEQVAAFPLEKKTVENLQIKSGEEININNREQDVLLQSISDSSLEDVKGRETLNPAKPIAGTCISSPISHKPIFSRIPVPVVENSVPKTQLETSSPVPDCPPKRRDIQPEPYYSSPVSPPRPVTPPRPVLPLKRVISQSLTFRQSATPPRPSSPTFSSCSSSRETSPSQEPSPRKNSAKSVSRSEQHSTPSSVQIFSAQSMNDINKALSALSKPANSCSMATRPQQPSQFQRSSLLLNEREFNHGDWLPTRSYTPLVPLITSRGVTTPTFQRPFSRQSTASPLRDLDLSDYSVYEMSRDFISRRTPSLLDSRSVSRMGSSSIISENNYSAITPEVSRKLSLSMRTEPKFPKDFGFVSSNNHKKEQMPKPPRRRSKEVSSSAGYSSSRPVSRLSNNSSREETPVNSPLFKPKEYS